LNRSAISSDVPLQLPEKVKALWETPLTGISLSGISATEKCVLVADKDDQQKFDIFRCLDADTGAELWNLTYPAAGEMDYSNSPRATPVICKDLVYVLGAFGHLHCLELATGRIVWQKQLIKESRAELTTWGMSATPLILDDKIIVNPGAKNASVVALNRFNGDRIWHTPGEKAAYASFIVGVFGGVRQIVGYDAISLGGWDLETGKRLWKLIPPEEGDFNVPTPIDLNGKLLVMTENNGTRIYNFDKQGKIIPKPRAQNFDLAHDCSSPVVADGVLIGSDYSKLACLDLKNDLKTRWIKEDELFDSYCSLIVGNDRVLITTVGGYLILMEANAQEYVEVSRVKLTEGKNEIWSHPALVGNRLYVRSNRDIRCLLLK
jgi:outer membrane protein assembly factor BamB